MIKLIVKYLGKNRLHIVSYNLVIGQEFLRVTANDHAMSEKSLSFYFTLN